MSKKALKSSKFTLPTIGLFATSPALSSPSDYPFFSRVIASDTSTALALIKAMRHLGWNRFYVLYKCGSGWGAANAVLLESNAAKWGMTMEYACINRVSRGIAATISSVDAALKNITRGRYSIILPFLWATEIQAFLNRAIEQKLLDRKKGTQFVFGTMDRAATATFEAAAGNTEVQGLLNGALDLTITTWEPGSKGGQRSSAFWAKTRGDGNASSFLAGASVMDARMYDSILLIAHAAQDCVYDKNNLCRVDNATQMMEKLRSARNVEGVASSLRIQPGTNNLQASRFEVMSLHTGYGEQAKGSNGSTGARTLVPKHVGHVGSETTTDVVDVCASGRDGNPRLGPNCGCTGWPTPVITARQKTNSSLRVAWASPILTSTGAKQGVDGSCSSLLRGYVLQAYLGEESIKAWDTPMWIPKEEGGSSLNEVAAEVHVWLGVGTSGGGGGNSKIDISSSSSSSAIKNLAAPWIQENKLYKFGLQVSYADPDPLQNVVAKAVAGASSGSTKGQVTSLDDATLSTMILSREVRTDHHASENNGASCIPPANRSTTNVCGLRSDQYHSQGQPGEQPMAWGARPCPIGAVCLGRVFDHITTKEGYVIQGMKRSIVTRARLRLGLDPLANQGGLEPMLQLCLRGTQACPGGAIIYNQMVGLPGRISEGPGLPYFLRRSSASAASTSSSGDGSVSTRTNTSSGGGGSGNTRSSVNSGSDTATHATSAIHPSPWYQCAEGFAGKRCDTCENGYAFTGMKGSSCSKCQQNLEEMWAIVAGGTLGICILAVFAWLVMKRHFRVFVARDALLVKCRAIERVDGIEGVMNVFNDAFDEARAHLKGKKGKDGALDTRDSSSDSSSDEQDLGETKTTTTTTQVTGQYDDGTPPKPRASNKDELAVILRNTLNLSKPQDPLKPPTSTQTTTLQPLNTSNSPRTSLSQRRIVDSASPRRARSLKKNGSSTFLKGTESVTAEILHRTLCHMHIPHTNGELEHLWQVRFSLWRGYH